MVGQFIRVDWTLPTPSTHAAARFTCSAARSGQGLLPTWFDRMTGRLDASANTYSVGGLGGPPRRRASVPICPGAPAVQALRSSSVLSQASSGRRPRAGPHRDACPLDGRRSALAAEASGGPGLGVSFWLAAQAQCCHMCGPPCTVVRCRAMQVLECSMSDRAEKRRACMRAQTATTSTC